MATALAAVSLDTDHCLVHVRTTADRDYCLPLIRSRGGALWIDGLRTTVADDREIGLLYDAIEARIAAQVKELDE